MSAINPAPISNPAFGYQPNYLTPVLNTAYDTRYINANHIQLRDLSMTRAAGSHSNRKRRLKSGALPNGWT